MKKLLLALVLTIALLPVNSFAGKLDKFESSVTEEKYEKKKHKKRNMENGIPVAILVQKRLEMTTTIIQMIVATDFWVLIWYIHRDCYFAVIRG